MRVCEAVAGRHRPLNAEPQPGPSQGGEGLRGSQARGGETTSALTVLLSWGLYGGASRATSRRWDSPAPCHLFFS